MAIRSLFDPRRFFIAPCMAPDSGDGGGGGDDGNNEGGDPPKVYTEEELKAQLEQSMARWRKGLQKELAEKTKKLEDMEASLKELKDKQQPPPANNADTVEGKIELLQQRHRDEMAEINKRLEQESAARLAAEQRAKETRRDTLIQKALADAGCRDLEGGYRQVIPDVVFDQLDEDYRIKTKSGNVVEITGDNLKMLLPDYLKVPAINGGGSGSTSGGPRAVQKQEELKREEKVLDELKSLRQPSQQDIAHYQVQKRKVQALRDEVATLTKK